MEITRKLMGESGVVLAKECKESSMYQAGLSKGLHCTVFRQIETLRFMPQDSFNKSLSRWVSELQSGGTTIDSLAERIGDKGSPLTVRQLRKLMDLKRSGFAPGD